MEDQEKLAKLQDAVVETILSMSPEEVMEDAAADDVASMKANLAAAIGKVGKERLARAKAAAVADARRPRPIGSAKGAEALREARANDATFDRKLTMAARTGGPDFEADREGIENDLEELRRWSEEDGDPA
jgi:hypothetical protein